MRRSFGALGAGPASSSVLLLAGALVVATAAAPRAARAAMVTEVADAGEKDKPIDINLDLRWERWQENGRLQRTFYDAKSQSTYQADEVDYQRAVNVLELGVHIGLTRNLEFHVSAPYIAQDYQSWSYANINGTSVQNSSTIQNNNMNAHGDVTNPATPLFSVPGTVYRGGFANPTIGMAWGIFDDGFVNKLPPTWYPSTDHVATWVIGLDWTIPLAPVMDPSAAHAGTPNTGSYLPAADGQHKLDFWTAMSKRLGVVEPFFKIHYMLPISAGNAYDNCSIAGHDAAQTVMSSAGQALCNAAGNDTFWVGKTGLVAPQIGGLLFGLEFHPLDGGQNGASVNIGLQFSGDFVSKGRTYSEISDVVRKLTYVDQYFDLRGQLTMDIRFNRWIHWVSFLAVGTFTPHLLTDESVGMDRNGDGKVTLDTNEVNPNYDFRLDQPGRQFTVSSVLIVGVSTRLSVDF